MNKTFFFAAALTAALVSGQNARGEQIFQTKNTFTLAKAVKLGRARISAFDQIGTLTESSSLSKGCSSTCYTCDTSTGTCTVCKSGYYLNGSGGCTSCPANATCDGSSAYTCASGYYDSGSGCSACTSPGNGTCLGCYAPGEQADCYDLVCNDGYVADGDTCMETTCDDYYRKSGTSCVANCTGVTCESGYTPVADYDRCCCEADESDSSSTSGSTTTCSAGYYVSGSSCVACSSGTWSSGGTATSCSSCSSIYAGGSNITCTSCTTDGTCTGSNGGSSSSSSSSSSSCTAEIGYTCVNGVKTACYYSTCASCATDTLKCISCQSGYTLSGSNCI